jgi:hypothetical protein
MKPTLRIVDVILETHVEEIAGALRAFLAASICNRGSFGGIHVLECLNGDRWRRWVPMPIRMILGVGFVVHGWAKWSRGPAAFAELLKQVSVPWPLAGSATQVMLSMPFRDTVG